MEQRVRERRTQAWPLMSFPTFMAFCKHAIRLCQKSDKPAAIANAAALAELEHIIVREYRRMERINTLGTNNKRFEILSYIRLQHMTLSRVLHVGPGARRIFNDAIEPFRARLPAPKRSALTAATRSRSVTYDKSIRGITQKTTSAKAPVSGCFLCDAHDHYASDQKIHPWVNELVCWDVPVRPVMVDGIPQNVMIC